MRQCSECKKPVKALHKHGCSFCSDECKKIFYKRRSDKTKKSNIEKYGVESISQIENVKQKKKQTCLKNFGFNNPSKVKKIQDKKKETKLEKYGDENYNNRNKNKRTVKAKYGVDNVFKLDATKEKTKETIFNKHGCEHYSQTKEYKEKFKSTNLERYGSEHPMQNADFFDEHSKKLFKHKEYKLPSGKIIKVQGYEPQMLDILFEQGYKEEDISTDKNKVPKIWYKTPDNKTHRYYSDIYIHKENLIIEVKSDYIYKLHEEINLLKQQACLDAGYKFEFKIL